MNGLRFVVTGKLERFTRKSIIKIIKENNGVVSDEVNAKTDYLIIGEKPGKKLEKAIQLQIPILNESQFIEKYKITNMDFSLNNKSRSKNGRRSVKINKTEIVMKIKDLIKQMNLSWYDYSTMLDEEKISKIAEEIQKKMDEFDGIDFLAVFTFGEVSQEEIYVFSNESQKDLDDKEEPDFIVESVYKLYGSTGILTRKISVSNYYIGHDFLIKHIKDLSVERFKEITEIKVSSVPIIPEIMVFVFIENDKMIETKDLSRIDNIGDDSILINIKFKDKLPDIIFDIEDEYPSNADLDIVSEFYKISNSSNKFHTDNKIKKEINLFIERSEFVIETAPTKVSKRGTWIIYES
jgi:hypothetical protein